MPNKMAGPIKRTTTVRSIDSHILPKSAAEASFLIPYYRSLPIYKFCVELNARLSMLHPDVLALLYHFGAASDGSVLEFGPYIGGSTIATARGIQDSGRSARITTVELSGDYSHSEMPTQDIEQDLRKNLADNGIDHLVDVVIGSSRDPAVIKRVTQLASGNLYGFLMIDSDGLVKEDLSFYRHLLARESYLMVDDFFAPGALDKASTTSADLDALEREGVVECLGVYGWGTWLGRFR